MSDIVRIDEFRERGSRHSPNNRYDIRVADVWVPWQGFSIPVLLDDAVIHTNPHGEQYATPVNQEVYAWCNEPEPMYASLEVTTPPRIVEYRTVINQDIAELDAEINALLADGWQPYMDQHARGPMVWQVMVRYGAEVPA